MGKTKTYLPQIKHYYAEAKHEDRPENGQDAEWGIWNGIGIVTGGAGAAAEAVRWSFEGSRRWRPHTHTHT